MYFKAIAIQMCNVQSDDGKNTVNSSSNQYSELTLNVQSAESITAIATNSCNIIMAAVLVIRG